MRKLLLLLALCGCDPQKEADALKAKASAEADRLAADAKSAAQAVASSAASSVRREVDDGIAKAKQELFGLTKSGALSATAKAALTQAATSDRAAELAANGTALLPVALKLAIVLNNAVDQETAIEPIYQPIPEGGQAELDASIAKMPQVEVVDGVKVGFRKVDTLDVSASNKEQTAVVLWRRGDHLVGFVYRSKRTIDIASLTKELPLLVKTANAAVAKS